MFQPHRPSAPFRIVVLLLSIAWCHAAPAQITVEPLDTVGSDGIADHVLVETAWYRVRFSLSAQGSAESLVFKPLDHELRAENYYSQHNNMFRGWVRHAEFDPSTGITRKPGSPEHIDQTRKAATYRVLGQTDDQVTLEFTWPAGAGDGVPPWMDKLNFRRRITLRNNTPAVQVEFLVTNNDTEAHPVLADVMDSMSLGRVRTACIMPGAEGRVASIDRAEEGGSTFIFAPDPSGAWLGGVNEQGLGGAFSFDWRDIDAMEVSLWKTVGASYIVAMRRRTIEPAQTLSYRYTFMPFTDFGTLDGMSGDLAGGVLVGGKADFINDVDTAALATGQPAPVRIDLASGTPGDVGVRIKCVRREDDSVVLDKTVTASLSVGKTARLEESLTCTQPGLYLLTVDVTAEAGATLRMEKPIRVGKSRLFHVATMPAGEKHGERDAGFTIGAPSLNEQFRTIDRSKVTEHLPLAKGHANGPVKAYFLSPADSTLGHIREIVQRADIDYDYFAVTKIQIPTDALNQQELRTFRQAWLKTDARVLVTPGIDFSEGLKRQTIGEILARVADDGVGLVLPVRDMSKQPELAEALLEAKKLDSSHPSPANAVMMPRVDRYELGKGRIAVITCNWSYYRDGGEALLGNWRQLLIHGKNGTAPGADPGTVKWRGFEYSYAHLADVIRWAARQESGVTITSAARAGNEATVTIDNAGDTRSAKLHCTFRSPRWQTLGTATVDVTLSPGGTTCKVPLPRFGAMAAEMRLLDDAGKLLAFASAGLSGSGDADISVIAERPYRSTADPGTFAVQIRAAALSQAALKVRVADRFGRVVMQAEQSIAMVNGAAEAEFSLAGFQPLDVYHEIVAELHTTGLIAEALREVFLLPPGLPYEDRFLIGMADGPERRALHVQGTIDTGGKLGITMHTHAHDNAVLYHTGGRKAAMIAVNPTRARYPVEGVAPKLDSKKLIMNPPLVPDDTAIANLKAKWQAQARSQIESGAVLIEIDDERRMSGDFDFHPQTLAAFRTWLKGRYADIAQLNAQWQSSFAGFDDVMPKSYQQLGEAMNPDTVNLAPWLEFRMFIGDVIGEHYMRAPSEWAAELGDVPVGEMGIYDRSRTWPVDWSRYARWYKHTQRYGSNQSALEELFRCFAPGSTHGQWMGYGMRRIYSSARLQPWKSLLNGGRFAWYWAMTDNGFWGYGLNTSDQRPTAGYAALGAEEFPDLTGGIDRLIIAGKFTDDGIAVGYSWPSWIVDSRALAQTAKTIVEELGYQHHYFRLDGLTTAGDYKLLIVQQASCLSRQEIDNIAAWASRGGKVLIVGRSGQRDDRGTPYAEGSPLDAVIGVNTSKAISIQRLLPVAAGDRPMSVEVELGGTTVAGAKVLIGTELDGATLPVLTVNTVGAGTVYWLNSDLRGHSRSRSAGVAGEISVTDSGPRGLRDSHHQLFQSVLDDAGLKPRLRIFHGSGEARQAILDNETWYYQSPSGRAMFVARHVSGLNDEPCEVQLTPQAEPRHVYDLRAGIQVGQGSTFHQPFPDGRMQVFALLPYKIAGVTASLSSATAAPGDVLTLRCQVQTDGQPADLHALRIHVRNPDGKVLPQFDPVAIAPDGKAEIKLPLALNEQPGRYVVDVTEIASGLKANATFEVK